MRHGSLYTKLINSREWRELRVQVLREQPLCQWCKAKGYIVAAREVHHLRECESGKSEQEVRDLMFSRSNCVALCHQCHSDWHKQQRYHSTKAVRQRQTERHEEWQDQMAKRFKGPSTEGDQG